MSDRNDLVTENLGLVHTCCHKFSGRGIDYDDLYQVGCMGLIKAADRFDDSLGFKFSTYAVPVILGELKRLFRDTGPIKVSRSLKEMSVKISAARTFLEHKTGKEPTVSEIADYLNTDAETVTEAVCACRAPESLTSYYNEDGEMKESDLGVLDRTEEITGRVAVECAMKNLSDSDRKIITARYFELKTQAQTAKEMNMTQVQVSRREKKILSELRRMLA